MIADIKRWLGANPWPTALVLCVVLASLATVYVVSDGDERAEMLLGVGSLGGVVLAIMRGLGPPRPNGNLTLLLAAGIGAATLTGCGAGALQSHATAATVLTVGVAGAGEVAVASVEAALGECSDEACVERIDREVQPAVATAHESLRVGVIAYREAVAIAAAAQAGDGVLDALVVALARVVREWDALAAALSSLLREELPGLPPIVRALLDSLAEQP